MGHKIEDLCKVKEWSKRDEILRIGSDGKDVVSLQKLCNLFMDDDLTRKLDEDGKFGKLTEDAVIVFQKYRMLIPDGIAGSNTKIDMYRAFKNKWNDHEKYKIKTEKGKIEMYGYWAPKVGFFPHQTYGEVSFFGGPTDCDDLMYGQAYLSDYNTDSPRTFAEKNQDVVDIGIIRSECLEIDEYPMVECGSKSYKAGPSWCLDNENGYYCAVPTDASFGLYGIKNPRIVMITKDGHVFVLLRSDKGPRRDLGCIDVSNVVERDANVKHDDMVIVGWGDFDLEPGYYGKIIRQIF